MSIKFDQITFTRLSCRTFLLGLLLTLFACASAPDATDTGNETAKESTSTDPAPANTDNANASTDASASAAGEPASAATPAADSKPVVAAEEAKPPRVVDSCKDEAYIKYEKQARDSMKKGLAATKAQKFGVGFRDVQEHNKWTKVHGSLFKNVSSACEILAKCGKKHKKDKDTECVEEAKTFASWEKLAKDFAAKAKTAETSQPPKICSPKPDLNDAARCFHGLADNIKTACDSDDCSDLSQCWNSVGYLDKAIIQAEQACGFVHQKLKDCRGYTEATKRRQNKFKQCADMQGRMKLKLFPIL